MYGKIHQNIANNYLQIKISKLILKKKSRGNRYQIVYIYWIIEKARELQKNICFHFIDYTKVSDYVDHNKLWKIWKEIGIPEHLTCLLSNLYAGEDKKQQLELGMEQQTGSQ